MTGRQEEMNKAFKSLLPLLHFLSSFQERMLTLQLIRKKLLVDQKSLNVEKQEMFISSTHPHKKLNVNSRGQRFLCVRVFCTLTSLEPRIVSANLHMVVGAQKTR